MPNPSVPDAPVPGATMRDRFGQVGSALLDEDPRAVVVLADISVDRFAAAARRNPGRVVNVGIREQLLVSVAAGFALTGMRPILHTYAPFAVERAFEQLKIDLCHQDVGAVVVTIGASHDWAAGGRTHHAPGDVALLDTLPGWTVYVPGHPDEVEPVLRAALAAPGRVYVRLSERGNAAARPVSGSLEVVRRAAGASAPVVVAVGPLVDAALEAVADLGVDVTVAWTGQPRPFDGAGLRALVGSGAVADVVLVEPYLAGTSAAQVAAALRDVPHRLLALGVPPVELRRYGGAAEHEAAYGLDAAGLRASIGAFLHR